MATPYPGHGSPPPPAPPGTAAAVSDSYFSESRKGEINELKNLLRGFGAERDPQRKRDIIKKVIAYMTLGIDVSRLFTEMMLAIETRDLVIKKMVYLYLTNYAKSHPELAQMCTNTLQKDCGNEDPMVRGLALRALCGLNLLGMIEYIREPLRRSLTDGHAYVRKTGVMGVLKLFYLDPQTFEECGFVDILYDMLRDPDASVVANCIIVLNEVMRSSPAGGMAINRAIMLHLLNRIHEFNEFAKVQVLELVPRYIAANEDEAYQIMNLLDPVLRTSGSGAVMATVSAFLSLAEQVGDDLDTMKRQIVNRVKPSLVTLISSGTSEMMYTLMKHVEALADLCPGVFDDEYRQFYVRYNEPTHVKYQKIIILPRLANPDTAPDIVSELGELVHDPNFKISRLAVRSMARIGCSGQGGPGAAEAIARRLIDMLDLNVAHTSSESAAALTLMVRKHPTLRTLVAPILARSLRFISEPSGKASVIYMLGECGELVGEAPYSLERLIDTYDDIDDTGVKTALLTATMKLFFLRPPEVQRMLGRLLAKACSDVSSQDLHDRSLLYYRMLKSGTDPHVLQRILKTDTYVPEGTRFTEEEDSRAELMTEFNTLSIVYGKPSVDFISPEFQVKYVRMPKEHPLVAGDNNKSHAGTNGFNGDLSSPQPVAAPPTSAVPQPHQPLAATAAAPAPMAEFDLLGFGGPPSPPHANHTTGPTGGGASADLTLNPSVIMSAEEYQSRWDAIPDKDALVSTIPMQSLPTSTDEVEQALASVRVMTMASGELATEFKFFLYAQDAATGSLVLIQGNIEKTSEPLMIVTVKVAGVVGPMFPEQLTELMTRAVNLQ